MSVSTHVAQLQSTIYSAQKVARDPEPVKRKLSAQNVYLRHLGRVVKARD